MTGIMGGLCLHKRSRGPRDMGLWTGATRTFENNHYAHLGNSLLAHVAVALQAVVVAAMKLDVVHVLTTATERVGKDVIVL